MSDAETHISESGEFVYPHLTKPDTRFDEAGLYKVTLKLSEAQAKNMISLFDKAIEGSIADAETNNKGKKIKLAPKPFKVEDGNAFFNFKMKATGINRKTKETYNFFFRTRFRSEFEKKIFFTGLSIHATSSSYAS